MYLLKGNGIKIFLLALCLIFGFGFAKFYQPQGKTYRIYIQALKDYENKNFSNSYFLFSKVGYLSDLKPYAIYRQAICAKVLGDKKSELNRYQELFKLYPRNKLIPEAKYMAGQLLLDENPDLALKYFNDAQNSNLGEDYQVAINFYKAKIAATKIKYSNKKISKNKKVEIENAFRKYLQDAPSGRLAILVLSTWQKFNPKPNISDKITIARTYYLAGMNKEADMILAKIKTKDKWAIQASNSYSLKEYQKTKDLVEEGVEKYDMNVIEEDYNRAIGDYLNLFDPKDKLKYINKLFSIAKGDKKAYIWDIKCQNENYKDKYTCYKDLYINFPKSKYAENALVEVFQYGIKNKNYAKCRELAKDLMSKYPESQHLPLIVFWAGKIEQYYGNPSYYKYYEQIINNYPDSYYAYRAFWILKGIQTATIKTPLEYKPVEYPYRYPQKGDALYSLMQVKDYDILSKLANDKFIDSWIEAEKGNYLSSVTIAQKAMDKLPQKPSKTDLRWRLVYPQNFYKQVQNFSEKYNNNDALIMAIIRTESTFNTEAQSPVGAIGLMQLMPATAHEIAAKHGITLNTSYLFNPELNIRLGNMYYSTIKEMLENKDVSAIAAYNGGIGSVTRWKSTLKYNDTDEFVEQIPYEETKNYVEKVFRSYWNYVRIYQK